MYDRTILRAAALKAGDKNANRLALRLGLPRNTAWRLWNGIGTPSAETAVAVHQAYRVKTVDLLQRAAA